MRMENEVMVRDGKCMGEYMRFVERDGRRVAGDHRLS